MEKAPFLYAFQVNYCLLRWQGLKNWNSIFIGLPYSAGVEPYWVGLKALVHIVYPEKYGWVEPFFTTIREWKLVVLSPSNLGWLTAYGILQSRGVV